jgi:hypothetical protein
MSGPPQALVGYKSQRLTKASSVPGPWVLPPCGRAGITAAPARACGFSVGVIRTAGEKLPCLHLDARQPSRGDIEGRTS